MTKQTQDEIKVLIRRRRAQMLVHSYLYYQLDDSIISDDLWQQWANELEKLQKSYPKLCKIEYYDKIFQDWDGTTGNHLPKNIIIEQKALQVKRAYDKFKSS
jgi:hypothetical protein